MTRQPTDHPPRVATSPSAGPTARRVVPTAATRASRWGSSVPELLWLQALHAIVVGRVAERGRDRGDVMQTVLMVAVGITMAVIAGTILINKVREKATALDTGTPAGG